MSLLDSVTRRLEQTRVPGTGFHGLKADWHQAWNSEIDEAAAALPANATLPIDLLHALMEQGVGRRRMVVIREQDRPVGLVSLREETGSHWIPALCGLIETGQPAITQDGMMLQCYLATGADVRRVLIREPNLRPRAVRSSTQMALYKLSLDTAEDYWHQSGNWRNIRKARNRGHPELQVDGPGSTEWVIKNWARKWGRQYDERDLTIAAKYFESVGRWHTLVMRDANGRGAGALTLANGSVLEGLCFYRDPEVEATALFDAKVRWAAEQGFTHVTWGGGGLDSYKLKWAPPELGYTEVSVAPWHIHGLYSIKNSVSGLIQRDGKKAANSALAPAEG